MAKSKEIPTQEILSSLHKKDIIDLQSISKKCAEILADQEKETEKQIEEAKTKLNLIRGKQAS